MGMNGKVLSEALSKLHFIVLWMEVVLLRFNSLVFSENI